MKTKKVLVVDDSKLLHRMFEMMLRGFPLVHAFDGREALDRLAEHKDVELILLDINMPRMNGLEFLTAVKAHPEFARIPVVIITESIPPGARTFQDWQLGQLRQVEDSLAKQAA